MELAAGGNTPHIEQYIGQKFTGIICGNCVEW